MRARAIFMVIGLYGLGAAVGAGYTAQRQNSRRRARLRGQLDGLVSLVAQGAGGRASQDLDGVIDTLFPE